MLSLEMRLSEIVHGLGRTDEMHETVIVKLSNSFAHYSISRLHQKHSLESVNFIYFFIIVRFNSVLQRRHVFPWPELVILACDILTSNARHPWSNPVMSASSQAGQELNYMQGVRQPRILRNLQCFIQMELIDFILILIAILKIDVGVLQMHYRATTDKNPQLLW